MNASQIVAIGQANELAAIKRQNAIARNGEELVAIAKRVLEWERAGFIRGGRTVGIARAVVARIEGASR